MLKSYLKTGTSISLIFILFALLSIFFIDRPLALAVHRYGFDQFFYLHYITEYFPTLFGICCLIILCFAKPNTNFGRRAVLILYLIALVGLTLWIKTKLKILFGRDWPKTWPGSHQTLINDNVFQFNIMKSSTWHGSFPSGHTTLMSILACSMAILYPRYKWLCYLSVLIVLLALITLNYHFLGDCFAGIVLGSFCAYYGIVLYLLIKGTD